MIRPLASILDNLKSDTTAALTGTLRTGTLRREIPGGPDGYGGTLPGTIENYSFQGMRGSYDAVTSGLSGIPRTDAKIEALASSLAIAPVRGDKINIEGEWWQVAEIEADPAAAWWILQCASTEAPA